MKVSSLASWRRLVIGDRGLTPLGILAWALGLSLIGAAAAAEGYVDSVSVRPVRLYLKDDRGRAVVSVTNNSAEILDVDVSCVFYKGTAKAGSGSGSVSRLPPHRTDTVDIADRQTMPLDSVRCDVAHAEK
jgi:hypothetical protein